MRFQERLQTREEIRMESPLQSVAPAMAHNGAGVKRPAASEGVSYQIMTVAAILVVLLSMWVF